jgi:hypothetical protein
MGPHDWFDWSNAGVGAAGLGLTLGAVWQAAGAKRAAQEARRAVYRRNSVEDITRIRDLALEFSSAIQTEHYELALHLAARFIAASSSARERHRGFLGADGGKLELAVDIMAAASQKTQMRPGMEQQDLVADAQRVIKIVSSVTGILDRGSQEEQQ